MADMRREPFGPRTSGSRKSADSSWFIWGSRFYLTETFTCHRADCSGKGLDLADDDAPTGNPSLIARITNLRKSTKAIELKLIDSVLYANAW
jgi:hypothetical protein